MAGHACQNRRPMAKAHHVVAQVSSLKFEMGINVAMGRHVIHGNNRSAKPLKPAVLQGKGGQCRCSHDAMISWYQL